jgi:hypothetical protein
MTKACGYLTAPVLTAPVLTAPVLTTPAVNATQSRDVTGCRCVIAPWQLRCHGNYGSQRWWSPSPCPQESILGGQLTVLRQRAGEHGTLGAVTTPSSRDPQTCSGSSACSTRTNVRLKWQKLARKPVFATQGNTQFAAACTASGLPLQEVSSANHVAHFRCRADARF